MQFGSKNKDDNFETFWRYAWRAEGTKCTGVNEEFKLVPQDKKSRCEEQSPVKLRTRNIWQLSPKQ